MKVSRVERREVFCLYRFSHSFLVSRILAWILADDIPIDILIYTDLLPAYLAFSPFFKPILQYQAVTKTHSQNLYCAAQVRRQQ